LENLVATELLEQRGWAKATVKVFHFRDAAGREVDLVLERSDGAIVGVEVKASATVSRDDFRGLRALQESAGTRFVRGVVVHTGTDETAFGEHLWAVPLHALANQPARADRPG